MRAPAFGPCFAFAGTNNFNAGRSAKARFLSPPSNVERIRVAPVSRTVAYTTASREEPSSVVAQELERRAGSKESDVDFDPLGPPSAISSLDVGGDGRASPTDDPRRVVTRLSRNPDIFLFENFVTSEERRTIMRAAESRGMSVAGTRRSDENTIRKNCRLTWIDPGDCEDGEVRDLVAEMSETARRTFVHESLSSRAGVDGVVVAEDLQVAKYDAGGSFGAHHDGFGRFLTVLTYLNGIGGTYFPYAQTSEGTEAGSAELEDDGVQGRDGLLIFGEEGTEDYVSPGHHASPGAVVKIKAGDAVAFYNYQLGEECASGNDSINRRSRHSSLTVQREKWIATNWYRSDKLTGPFAGLHRDALLADRLK